MKRWPDVRAGLIAAAIAAGMIEGCPLPQRGYERDWQRGYVAAIRPVQEAIGRPVAWVPRSLRFSQRWALFQVGARERYRLEVEGRVGGAWTLLFRAGDPEHRAYAGVLEHRRVSGVWNPTDRVAWRYPHFTAWFTARVLADRPELEAVRIRQEKVVVGFGEVLATGDHAFSYTRARSRGGAGAAAGGAGAGAFAGGAGATPDAGLSDAGGAGAASAGTAGAAGGAR